MAREREKTGDEAALAPALATGPAPFGATAQSINEASFNPDASLAQLLQLMQHYQAAGLIQQRADGAFVLPGQKDSAWDQRLQIGSTCLCPACTEHNQRHWVCMVCGSSHEWVMVQDRPRIMRTQLGSAGRAGHVHLVDSNECGLEYRRRMGLGGDVVSAMGLERPIPVAGGIEDDRTGFFLGA